MSFDLDDAHETLAYIEHELRDTVAGFHAYCAAYDALAAIEAQLPEPCPQCGSDQCATTFPDGLKMRRCEWDRLGTGSIIVW